MQKSSNFLDKIFLLRSPHDFCRPCHRNLSESGMTLRRWYSLELFYVFLWLSDTSKFGRSPCELSTSHCRHLVPRNLGGSRCTQITDLKRCRLKPLPADGRKQPTTAVFWRVVSAHRLWRRLYVKAPYSFLQMSAMGPQTSTALYRAPNDIYVDFANERIFSWLNGGCHICIYRFLFVFVYIYTYIHNCV